MLQCTFIGWVPVLPLPSPSHHNLSFTVCDCCMIPWCRRIALASLALHGAKRLIRFLTRKAGRRVSGAVDFVLDACVPTHYLGRYLCTFLSD
jgi:hypothetical protein